MTGIYNLLKWHI